MYWSLEPLIHSMSLLRFWSMGSFSSTQGSRASTLWSGNHMQSLLSWTKAVRTACRITYWTYSRFFGLAFGASCFCALTNHLLRWCALLQPCISRPPTPFHSCCVVVLSEVLLAVIALLFCVVLMHEILKFLAGQLRTCTYTHLSQKLPRHCGACLSFTSSSTSSDSFSYSLCVLCSSYCTGQATPAKTTKCRQAL